MIFVKQVKQIEVYVKEYQADASASNSHNGPAVFYASITAIVVLMFLLVYNTGEWRVVSQQDYSADSCQVDIRSNAYQVMVNSQTLDLDSLRINLTQDSASSAVTITSYQRDMRIIGESERTSFAEITLWAPQISSSSFTLYNRL